MTPDGVEPKEYIWKTGLALLKKQGISEGQARSLLGKACKAHGEKNVAERIAHASISPKVELKAYLMAPKKVQIPIDDDRAMMRLCQEYNITTRGKTKWELRDKLLEAMT
jgi:hypothetical protein